MIYLGHDESRIWNYTPRRAVAYHYFGMKRELRNEQRRLAISALAASGDGKRINKALKDMRDEERSDG